MTHPRKQGFTLVELLVVIGIIAVLVGILLPALNKARASASKIKCASQLRNLGQALAIYSNTNKGKMPQHAVDGMAWLWDVPVETRDKLVKCGASRAAWYCPDFPEQDADALWNFNGNFVVVGYFLMTTRIKADGTIYRGTQPNREWLDVSFLTGRHFVDSMRPKIPNWVLIDPAKPLLTKPSDIELASDAIVFQNNTWSAAGGWTGGKHVTSHIKGGLPTGANILYLDSHVDWRVAKYKNTADLGDVKWRGNAGNIAQGAVRFYW